MLPGTAVTYSGEELGMENAPVMWGAVGDSATPEHSHKKNSGKRHWLRVRVEKVSALVTEWVTCTLYNGDVSHLIADDTWSPLQTSHKPAYLDNYKALVRARHDPSIMYGALNIKVLSDSVFAITRYWAVFRSHRVRNFLMKQFYNWSTIHFIMIAGVKVIFYMHITKNNVYPQIFA